VRYHTEVVVRWSDMDAYRHVNHARTVTLLEDARTGLVFTEATHQGAGSLARGIVVVRVEIDYRTPLIYTGEPIVAAVWVTRLRWASFTLGYELRQAKGERVAVRASTVLAPFDVAAGAPRRLTAAEREFLSEWTDDEPPEGGGVRRLPEGSGGRRTGGDADQA
jgi:acyl-CoA thioester hydrolase